MRKIRQYFMRPGRSEQRRGGGEDRRGERGRRRRHRPDRGKKEVR